MNLSERIALAVRASGLSQKDVAARVGVSPGAITQWKKGEIQSLKANNLLALAKATHVNPEWLANGSGEMIRDEEIDASVNEVFDTVDVSHFRPRKTSKSYDWDNLLIMVGHYVPQVAGGSGDVHWLIDHDDPVAFKASWFEEHRVDPNACRALYMPGRSMVPKLENRDTVLIDTSKTEIIDGEIYAAFLHGELFIRTVERIAGGVKLKSENPDFDSIEVRGEELAALKIIGKKVWRGG